MFPKRHGVHQALAVLVSSVDHQAPEAAVYTDVHLAAEALVDSGALWASRSYDQAILSDLVQYLEAQRAARRH